MVFGASGDAGHVFGFEAHKDVSVRNAIADEAPRAHSFWHFCGVADRP